LIVKAYKVTAKKKNDLGNFPDLVASLLYNLLRLKVNSILAHFKKVFFSPA